MHVSINEMYMQQDTSTAIKSKCIHKENVSNIHKQETCYKKKTGSCKLKTQQIRTQKNLML